MTAYAYRSAPYSPPRSTTLQVDSSTGLPGTVINGENQFGLDSSDLEPKFQAMVRVGDRNRLSFDYFTLDRSGNATVAEPIVFRDAVLQPATRCSRC